MQLFKRIRNILDRPFIDYQSNQQRHHSKDDDFDEKPCSSGASRCPRRIFSPIRMASMIDTSVRRVTIYGNMTKTVFSKTIPTRVRPIKARPFHRCPFTYCPKPGISSESTIAINSRKISSPFSSAVMIIVRYSPLYQSEHQRDPNCVRNGIFPSLLHAEV